MRSIAIVSLVIALLSGPAAAQTPGERTQILADFQQRLADYARLVECLDASHALAPVQIVTLPAATVLRQLIATVPEGHAPRTVIRAAGPNSPGPTRIMAGQPFPAAALRPFPGGLANVLPILPTRFEYRLIGEDLVIRDLHTDLIVAVLPAALHANVGTAGR